MLGELSSCSLSFQSHRAAVGSTAWGLLLTLRVDDRPAGVVDQFGETQLLRRERTFGQQCGEGGYRTGVEQVQPVDVDAFDTGQCAGRAVRIACADRHRSARLAQRARDLQTETTVASGADDVGAGQVDAREHLVRRRRGGEA